MKFRRDFQTVAELANGGSIKQPSCFFAVVAALRRLAVEEGLGNAHALAAQQIKEQVKPAKV